LDNNKVKNYAIGTLTLALLISLGFAVTPDDNFVCRSLEITKYCDRLSSTERTCYSVPGTTAGKKLCPEPWEEIAAVQQPHIITIYQQSNIGTVWKCSSSGCNQIK